jgi:sporulation protein YlmC with PRC-barrel domain
MLVLKERLVAVPIMSLQTGSEIAQTVQPLIDPRQLTVVAFYCQGPRVDINPAILHIDDIRESGSLGFIVDSADVLMSPQDLVRLQQVISFNFSLEGKLVVEENGHKIGKVTNYTTDLRSFYITQLEVQPSVWKSWGTAHVLIGRTQIIEINDQKIVVRSATEPVVAPKKIVENPFSAHRAQPEASHAHTDTARDKA